MYSGPNHHPHIDPFYISPHPHRPPQKAPKSSAACSGIAASKLITGFERSNTSLKAKKALRLFTWGHQNKTRGCLADLSDI